MKKILLAIFALLPVVTAFAQADLTPSTRNFDQYLFGEVQYGFAQFHGDVSNKDFFTKIYKESKPSLEISLGRQFIPALSFKVTYSSSSYFSKGKLFWSVDTINKRDLSVSGRINEFGISGTLNLNKLFDRNSGNNWNAYISGGIGITSWHCALRDDDSANDSIFAEVKNSNYINHSIPKNSIKIGLINKLASSIALGAHFQLTDKIGLDVEHAFLFTGSALIDGYGGGTTDVLSKTTLGVTFKLQKLTSLFIKSSKDKLWSYPTSQSKQEKGERRTKKGASKPKPEIQEYTGFTALLPPPQPKVDTTRKAKSGAINSGKNIWVAESDSGQLQITGSGKVTNEVYTGPEPQVSADLKTGLVPTYRVQIQASKTYIQVESVIRKFDLKEKVYVELRSDGWYRYYIGQYALLQDARARLAEMHAKGLNDCFIVSFKTNTRKVIK